MTLLADHFPSNPQAASGEGGVAEPQRFAALATLSTPVEFMVFCPVCESEQAFIAAWDCIFGLVGCCARCGDTRIAPFTRTNSEAA